MLAASAASVPGAAEAHEEVPGTSNVIDAVEPRLPGVTVEVLVSAADQLVVENTTPTALAVIAEDGQPFLRIGAGVVEANLASKAWYESNSPTATAKIPPSVVPGAPAQWVQIASTPSWGWFDHRLHRQTLAAPREVGIIEAWTVPMRFGDQPVEVRGHRSYARPRGRFLTSIDKVPRDFLIAQVVDGTVPALLLRVQGDHEVTIVGRGAESVAVLGAKGTMVNDASPIWRVTAGARGDTPDGPVGEGESPRFEREADVAQLTWLEPRAQYRAKSPPKGVEDAATRVVLGRWEVPLRIDGSPGRIEGRIEWIPIASAARGLDRRSGLPPWAIAAVIAAIAVLLALATLRRHRTPTNTNPNAF